MTRLLRGYRSQSRVSHSLGARLVLRWRDEMSLVGAGGVKGARRATQSEKVCWRCGMLAHSVDTYR